MGVVQTPLGDGRTGDRGAEDVRASQHGQCGEVAAEAPPPDPDPNERPDVYDDNSLLPLAHELRRPLLLIHGLADDNVVAAHTLQLSRALLEAGRPHTVLPLSGVTHMTPQEEVAENLLLHQLDFLRRSLPSDTTPSNIPKDPS